jgi:hypothetical protein
VLCTGGEGEGVGKVMAAVNVTTGEGRDATGRETES